MNTSSTKCSSKPRRISGYQGICEDCGQPIHLEDKSLEWNDMAFHEICYTRKME